MLFQLILFCHHLVSSSSTTVDPPPQATLAVSLPSNLEGFNRIQCGEPPPSLDWIRIPNRPVRCVRTQIYAPWKTWDVNAEVPLFSAAVLAGRTHTVI